MKLLSPILAEVAPGYVQWFCPGCQDTHHIPISDTHNPGRAWGWNGDAEKPSFTPSVFVRSGHYVPGYDGQGCYCNTPAPDGEEDWGFACHSCHVFVTDGRIQFLSDCSHALAGQTVDMVPIPRREDAA